MLCARAIVGVGFGAGAADASIAGLRMRCETDHPLPLDRGHGITLEEAIHWWFLSPL